MEMIRTLFLGIVQGLTEFLPISSSGHLVVFQHLLGFTEPDLLLDTALHVGTLAAVCVYFRSSLAEMGKGIVHSLRRTNGRSTIQYPEVALVPWIIVGTIPTGLIGFIFREPLEGLFASVGTVGFMLLITGGVVAATRLLPEGYGGRSHIGWITALAVGTAQGLAIIPGISRSGATIACGMMFALDRDLAGRFSFLLAIPAIVGAFGLQLVQRQSWSEVALLPLTAGFVASVLTGLLALKILMSMVHKGRLYYFAPYCWGIGLLVLLLAHKT
jgi:undecaprenyl-diphosphatase